LWKARRSRKRGEARGAHYPPPSAAIVQCFIRSVVRNATASRCSNRDQQIAAMGDRNADRGVAGAAGHVEIVGAYAAV
jgi:hypothetical protein